MAAVEIRALISQGKSRSYFCCNWSLGERKNSVASDWAGLHERVKPEPGPIGEDRIAMLPAWVALKGLLVSPTPPQEIKHSKGRGGVRGPGSAEQLETERNCGAALAQ